MSKVLVGNNHGKAYHLVRCPACGNSHSFDERWTFNGDLEKPTFFPSMLVTSADDKGNKTVCHSFLTEGVWNYCADSTHKYAGQHVPAPDYDRPVT